MTEDTLPHHIAIIMDGNTCWAKNKSLPVMTGHVSGFKTTLHIIDRCLLRNINILTLFISDQEHFIDTTHADGKLMDPADFFFTALSHAAEQFEGKPIQFRVVGDRSKLNQDTSLAIQQIEQNTLHHSGLIVVIVMHYHAQEELAMVMHRIAMDIEKGNITSADVTPELIQSHLILAGLPDPDFFIRTHGEQRLNNTLLWQLAYTELYFSELHWPDFDSNELDRALDFYANRERRFGYISEQLGTQHHA